jgi:hypothetical protein
MEFQEHKAIEAEMVRSDTRIRELEAERDALRAENERLLRGDFTDAELQSLCHNRDGKGYAAFVDGCSEYQWKLFGQCERDTLAARVKELEAALQAERKRSMTGGDETEPGCDEETYERIMDMACAPGLSIERRSGQLLAAWRTWFGTGGPGLFNRLQMADDMARVWKVALAETLTPTTDPGAK